MTYRRKSNKVCQGKLMLYLYMAFLTVLSVSVLIMPLGVKQAVMTNMYTYISGSMFWIGFIGSVAMASYISHSRKKNMEFAKVYPNHKRLGLIHFFRNKPAFICDIMMFVGLIGFIMTRIWAEMSIGPYIFLSVLIFSFGMHCMLNGSNYTYINYKIKGSD